MRKGLGLAMLMIGLLPIAALLVIGWWARPVYTVDLSMSPQATIFLIAFGLIDAALVGTGVWLFRPRRSAN